ncbi:MAG: Fe-S cluster assembly protein SufD [Ardenticatenales bacterium]
MTTTAPTPTKPSAPVASVATPAGDAFLAEYAAQSRANGHAPAWLSERRAAAAALFAASGLPTTRQESWRKTNLQPLATIAFAHAESLAPARSDESSAALDRLSLPAMGGHRLVFVNGAYDRDRSSIGPLPAGVTVTTLAEAWRAGDAAAADHYGRYVDDAPFSAINTALAHDGALIVVPAGVHVETPIHLVFACDSGVDIRVDGRGDGRGDPRGDDRAAASPVAHHPRVLIVAGANSRVTVVESYGGLGVGDVYLTNAVTEVVVAEGAEVDHTKRQLESEAAFHMSALHVVQTGASRFTNHNIALGGRLVRNDLAVQIDASECDTLLHGLYMGHGRQHIDNHTRLEHAQPHCHSFELYKGVLDGYATGVFTGRIKVYQDAQQTDAVQENRCLLLSDTATINTQPQLEIFADDVKCTHGASVGELDVTQLTYLRTRGLPDAEAHGILTYAYANEIIERIPVEAVRDELEGLVRSRVRESQRLRD